MSKRGRDLFELLAMRQGGSSARGKRQSRSKDRDSRVQLGARIGALLANLLQPRRGRVPENKGRRRRGDTRAANRAAGRGPAPVTLSSTWLVALLLVALGGGFLLGRGTAGASAPEDLRTGKKVEKMLPGRLPAGEGSSDLGRAEEVRTLSGDLLVVLNYYEHERDKARDLAQYLRSHGVETARIRPGTIGTTPETRKNVWSVVVYVLDKKDQDDYIETIRGVPPPPFDERGRFARRLARPFALTPLY